MCPSVRVNTWGGIAWVLAKSQRHKVAGTLFSDFLTSCG